MTKHPAELSLNAILRMDRQHVVEALREFGEHCELPFDPESLSALDLDALRRVLRRVRRFYQSKGY